MKEGLFKADVVGGPDDGSWNPVRDEKGAEIGLGRLGATIFNCLNLEVYYRYLPMYR